MNNKKVFLLLISLVMMSLFANVVSAQEEPGVGESLAEAFNTIKDLFSFIPELITLEKLVSGESAAVFWAKFLVWLVLFASIYFGTSFVFKDRKNIQIIVALALSFIGTLGIPASWIIGIFKTYTLTASFLVFFIPVIAGLFLAHQIKFKIIKVVIYIGLIGILTFIRASLTSPDSILDVGGMMLWVNLLYGVVILALIWNIATAWGPVERLGNKVEDVVDNMLGVEGDGGETGGGYGGGDDDDDLGGGVEGGGETPAGPAGAPNVDVNQLVADVTRALQENQLTAAQIQAAVFQGIQEGVRAAGTGQQFSAQEMEEAMRRVMAQHQADHVTQDNLTNAIGRAVDQALHNNRPNPIDTNTLIRTVESAVQSLNLATEALNQMARNMTETIHRAGATQLTPEIIKEIVAAARAGSRGEIEHNELIVVLKEIRDALQRLPPDTSRGGGGAPQPPPGPKPTVIDEMELQEAKFIKLRLLKRAIGNHLTGGKCRDDKELSTVEKKYDEVVKELHELDRIVNREIQVHPLTDDYFNRLGVGESKRKALKNLFVTELNVYKKFHEIIGNIERLRLAGTAACNDLSTTENELKSVWNSAKNEVIDAIKVVELLIRLEAHELKILDKIGSKSSWKV